MRRKSRRNTHLLMLYSIHTLQRLMLSVDETGPGFSPSLFFVTMSYTMKICFLVLLLLQFWLRIWKFQLFCELSELKWFQSLALINFSMRRKNLSSADVLCSYVMIVHKQDLFMLHNLAKTVMGIVLWSSSQKFKLLASVFIKETSFSSCLSWTV